MLDIKNAHNSLVMGVFLRQFRFMFVNNMIIDDYLFDEY